MLSLGLCGILLIGSPRCALSGTASTLMEDRSTFGSSLITNESLSKQPEPPLGSCKPPQVNTLAF